MAGQGQERHDRPAVRRHGAGRGRVRWCGNQAEHDGESEGDGDANQEPILMHSSA